MKEVLAIIPARGGSKGLPGKNKKRLAGHPLIAYSIQAALICPAVSRVIVTTDSGLIASIAKRYGAEVPFIRPSAYAQDLSPDLDVFIHALEWLKSKEGYVPDLVVQFRPTSPVRFREDIENCISIMQNVQADSLRTVTASFHSPYKMWLLGEENEPMKPLLQLDRITEPYNQPRQNLPATYWQTGTLDVIRTRVITEQRSMSGESILPYVIAQQFAIDIDDLSGFHRAEEIIRTCDCIKFQP